MEDPGVSRQGAATTWIITARKRSLGQGNVLYLCFILFTGGRGVCQTSHKQIWGWADTTFWIQTPPGLGRSPILDADPLGRLPPLGLGRPPLGLVRPPWMQTRPGLEDPPPIWMQASSPGLGRPSPPIRSTSGRYASYWNVYLFGKILAKNCMKMKEIWPRRNSCHWHPLLGSTNARIATVSHVVVIVLSTLISWMELLFHWDRKGDHAFCLCKNRPRKRLTVNCMFLDAPLCRISGSAIAFY